MYMKNAPVRFALWFVGLILGLTFLFRMSNNMVQTTAPLLGHDVLHMSNQEIGILASTFGGAVVLATFTINSWVRCYQIERAIGIGFVLLALTFPIYAFVNSFWELVIVFGLSGFASGIIQPFLLTLITKYSTVAQRDRSLALYTLALSFSLILGPLLEALVLQRDQDNLRVTFTLFTLIPVLGIILSGISIFEGPRASSISQPIPSPIKNRASIRTRLTDLSKNRTYLVAIIGNMTYVIPFVVIVTFGGVYAVRNSPSAMVPFSLFLQSSSLHHLLHVLRLPSFRQLSIKTKCYGSQ